MNTKQIVAAVLMVLVIAGCKKDNFETKPAIKIKSITPEDVVKGNLIKLEASFTDKEGDIADSVTIVIKTYNGNQVLDSLPIRYSMSGFGIPSGTKEGDILVQFVYNDNIPPYVTLPGVNVDTPVSFGIVLRDKAGNKSDYVESKKILLRR